MIELMIETWSDPRSGATYRWSLWRDGTRVTMGGPHGTPAESEAEGLAHCADQMRCQPDRVTRL